MVLRISPPEHLIEMPLTVRSRSKRSELKQHGDDAPIEAAMRADELAEDGDVKGRPVWIRIVKAIEELLSEERPGDAEVH